MNKGIAPYFFLKHIVFTLIACSSAFGQKPSPLNSGQNSVPQKTIPKKTIFPVQSDCKNAIVINLQKSIVYGLTIKPEGFGAIQEIRAVQKGKYIFEEFSKACHPLKVKRVQVWESETASVVYSK